MWSDFFKTIHWHAENHLVFTCCFSLYSVKIHSTTFTCWTIKNVNHVKNLPVTRKPSCHLIMWLSCSKPINCTHFYWMFYLLYAMNLNNCIFWILLGSLKFNLFTMVDSRNENFLHFNFIKGNSSNLICFVQVYT